MLLHSPASGNTEPALSVLVGSSSSRAELEIDAAWWVPQRREARGATRAPSSVPSSWGPGAGVQASLKTT